MARMGIAALYCKPNTSRRGPQHAVYAYVLRGLTVTAPNQVWAMDTTYVSMRRASSTWCGSAWNFDPVRGVLGVQS